MTRTKCLIIKKISSSKRSFNGISNLLHKVSLGFIYQNLNMASAMEIDDEESDLPTSSSSKGEKKRFEVKKVRQRNWKNVL